MQCFFEKSGKRMEENSIRITLIGFAPSALNLLRGGWASPDPPHGGYMKNSEYHDEYS